MKKFSFFLLLFFSSFFAFAQDKQIQYFDENWYPCAQSDAMYYRVITYDEEGNPKGIVRDYYITGELQWQGKIISEEDNTFDSLCIWYYRNGQIEQKIYYSDRPEGEDYIVYYYENGDIKHRNFPKKDKNEDSSVTYYKGGRVESALTSVNGKREGKSLQYYEDGQVFVVGYYVNDKCEGVYTQYYPNGHVKNVAHWSKGLLKGESVSYFNNGKVSEKASYVNGNLAGEYYQYYESGQANRHTKYNQEGKVYWSEGYFSNGTVLEQGYYNADSTYIWKEYYEGPEHLLSHIEYRYANGNYRDTTWWNNGQLKMVNHSRKSDLILLKEYDRYGYVYKQTPVDSNKVHPVKNNSSCLYGFKNLRGSMVVLPQYEVALPFWKGYSIVSKNNLWGLVDQYGNVVMPLKYEHLAALPLTCEQLYSNDEEQLFVKGGYYRFKLNDRYGIIDIKGKVIVPARYTDIEVMGYGYFLIKKTDLLGDEIKCGFADTTGVIVEPRYARYEGIEAPGLIRFKESSAGGFLVVNGKGEIVIPTGFDHILYRNGCFLVWKNKNVGLYSSSGKVLLEPVYKINEWYSYMPESSYSLLQLRKDSLHGLYDMSGKWVLKPEYKIAYEMPDMPYCFASHSDKLAIYTKEGKSLTEEKYDYIGFRSYERYDAPVDDNYYFSGHTDAGSEILNRDGRLALPGLYDHVHFYVNKYLIVAKGNKVSAYRCDSVLVPVSTDELFVKVFEKSDLKCLSIDESLRWIINANNELIYPQDYYISQTQGGYAVLHSEAGCGVINQEGEVIIEVGNYRDIFFGKDNTFIVMKEGLMGLVNEKGKTILPIRYHAITDYDDTIKGWWVYTEERSGEDENDIGYTWDSRWGAVNVKKKTIIPQIYYYPLSFDNKGQGIGRIRNGSQVVNTKGKVLLQTGGKLEYYNNALFTIYDEGTASLVHMNSTVPDSSVYYSDITIPLGAHALLYSGDTQILMDTTGKIVYTAENGFHRTDFDLSEYIIFSSYANDKGYYDGYMMEGEEVVSGYDKLSTLDNDRARILISNLFYVEVARNYSLINADVYFYTNKFDLSSSDLVMYADPNEYYEHYENVDFDHLCSSTYDISLEAVNQRSFSYINSSTYCCSGYHSAGYCDYDMRFINYAISADSIWEISLGELFVLGEDYATRIDKLLRSKLTDVEGLEIDCSNQDSNYLFDSYGNNVVITPEGLKFYIFETDEDPYNYDDEDGNKNYTVTIEYNLLYDIINKNSVLGEFVR